MERLCSKTFDIISQFKENTGITEITYSEKYGFALLQFSSYKSASEFYSMVQSEHPELKIGIARFRNELETIVVPGTFMIIFFLVEHQ